MPKTLLRVPLLVFLALAFAFPVFAATDPTLHQVYEAAHAGHLAEAQQMMSQVLRDHPKSGKAHYVSAELYARQGNIPRARQELNTAQALEPGLPFASAAAVQELQRQLARGRPVHMRVLPTYPQAHSFAPWGVVVVVLAGAGLLWMLFRRRTAPSNLYSHYQPGVPSVGGAPGYPPGYGPGVGPAVGGSGIGSGIAGGLASGLAVGAGVVAGEELAHHFLDGRPEGGAVPVEPVPDPENGDLGGPDFGVSDGSSWDDDSSSLGGFGGDDSGGDDWT